MKACMAWHVALGCVALALAVLLGLSSGIAEWRGDEDTALLCWLLAGACLFVALIPFFYELIVSTPSTTSPPWIPKR